jgi:hypothetical protein
MRRASLIIGALGLFLLFFVQAAQPQWTAAKRLTWNSGQSKFPAITVDSMDATQVVWSDNTPGDFEIYHKRKKVEL